MQEQDPVLSHLQETTPSAWVRLVASDFDGWWLGLTEDWEDTLPCDGDYLATYRPARRSPPLWVPSLCLTRIPDWAVARTDVPPSEL